MNRQARLVEVFEVRCWLHGGLVEIPRAMIRGNVANCPRCGAVLVLIWSAMEEPPAEVRANA